MKFKDLSMSFEKFESFIQMHNIQIDDSCHNNWTSQKWLEHFRYLNTKDSNSGDKLIIRPIYYYGDSIIAFQIEEKINATNSIYYYWEIIY